MSMPAIPFLSGGAGGGFGIQGSPSTGWNFYRPAGTPVTEKIASFGVGATEVAFIRGDGYVDATGTIRAQGDTAPSSGSGVEIALTGGAGRILAYNRTAPAYLQLALEASSIILVPGGGISFTAASTVNTSSVPLVFASYTLATLPSAASFNRAQIWVSDMTGGAQYAYSDGANWRRVSDHTTAS